MARHSDMKNTLLSFMNSYLVLKLDADAGK